MSIILDRKSAAALVRYERDRSRIVYAEYIAANDVTLETVSEHVKALAELAFPDFTPDASDDVKAERKGFMNRVRNGLNHRLGKRTPSQEATTASAGAVEETAEEASQTSDNGTVTVAVGETPAEAIHRAIQAAYAAGLTRDDILAAVEGAL